MQKKDVYLPREIRGFSLILHYLGIAYQFIGGLLLLPLIVLIWYPNEALHARAFLLPGILTILIGYLMVRLWGNGEPQKLERNQDALLVLVIWVSAIFISSLPFWLSGNYRFAQSMFEATSGLSTTGLSVVDVESAPHVYLMYRSLLLFVGGVGLVLIFTSVISDRYGVRLYNAEGHGDQLMPNLKKTARVILTIYGTYIILGTIAYVAFGMPLFDAVNHSIAAVSTGGFSTRAASIGHYQSLPIEVVTILLMLLGGTNFFIHLHLLRGHVKTLLRHAEFRFMLVFFAIMVPLSAFSLMQTGLAEGASFRVGLFQFVSAISTTGFQTISDFHAVPSVFYMIVVVSMVIGAGIGSTGGGVKRIRIAQVIKSLFWSIRDRVVHPRKMTTHRMVRVGQNWMLSETDIGDNFAFVGWYLVILVLGTMLFTLYGHGLQDSLFEFASSLGTVGLSVGITGPHAPDGILWISMCGMLLGRLEIYVVLVGLARLTVEFRKKQE